VQLNESLYSCKLCGSEKKRLFSLPGVKRHISASDRKDHGIKNPVKGVHMIEVRYVGGNTGYTALIHS
jgi:hypothetical protein